MPRPPALRAGNVSDGIERLFGVRLGTTPNRLVLRYCADHAEPDRLRGAGRECVILDNAGNTPNPTGFAGAARQCVILDSAQTTRKPSGCAGLFGLQRNTSVALRTEKQSSPEKTMCKVLPSALIHLVGKLALSPGPTSHRSL